MRPTTVLLLLSAAPLVWAAEPSKCGMGGAKCAMRRDCCEAHDCVEGDWAETSDYTCERVGPKPSEVEYLNRLRKFYELHNPSKASDALELETTLAKWKDREELLFHVLRQKYISDDHKVTKTEL
eukprot:scaffold71028_cov31-Tisochrysis_lutea.AAC.1